MEAVQAFAPISAGTSTISITTSSAATQVNPAPGSLRMRLYNAGPSTIFVEFGNAGVTAAVATGLPIPAGQTESFSFGRATHLAAITAAGTATLYATPGEGV
jgi:hypothetical protein